MKYLLSVFFLSMVPLIEQRGAIPLGVIVHHLNPWLVFIVSLLGSFVPAPFIFLFFQKVLDWLKKIKQLDKFTNFVEKKVQSGAKKIQSKLEVGLIFFIGIPIPTTGLWTGSAIASFLGFDFKKSMVCVFLGGIMSAAIVTAVSVFLPKWLGY